MGRLSPQTPRGRPAGANTPSSEERSRADNAGPPDQEEIALMDDQDRSERISDKLRRLVDLIDKHPAIEQFPEMFGYRFCSLILGTHLVGDEAAQIDRFADAFGVKVVHRPPHPPGSEDAGARYTCVETTIDGVVFELQCRTEDYEKATGKTVDNGGAQ